MDLIVDENINNIINFKESTELDEKYIDWLDSVCTLFQEYDFNIIDIEDLIIEVAFAMHITPSDPHDPKSAVNMAVRSISVTKSLYFESFYAASNDNFKTATNICSYVNRSIRYSNTEDGLKLRAAAMRIIKAIEQNPSFTIHIGNKKPLIVKDYPTDQASLKILEEFLIAKIYEGDVDKGRKFLPEVLDISSTELIQIKKNLEKSKAPL